MSYPIWIDCSPSEEWLQQKDYDMYERIAALSPIELNAELIAMGFTVDEIEAAVERIKQGVQKALEKWKKENEAKTDPE